MWLAADVALLVIDLQKAIDDPRWAKDGPRNNPEAEANIARLLASWREAGRPIFHIRHDSTEPQSAYRPGQPGNDFKAEALPLPGEAVIAKRTNSAFIGTDLERRLRGAGIRALVVAGVITNDKAEIQKRPNYGGFYRSSWPLPAVLPAVGRSLWGHVVLRRGLVVRLLRLDGGDDGDNLLEHGRGVGREVAAEGHQGARGGRGMRLLELG
jgi:hypothetical protein